MNIPRFCINSIFRKDSLSSMSLEFVIIRKFEFTQFVQQSVSNGSFWLENNTDCSNSHLFAQCD